MFSRSQAAKNDDFRRQLNVDHHRQDAPKRKA
jgi:hypothetical protein